MAEEQRALADRQPELLARRVLDLQAEVSACANMSQVVSLLGSQLPAILPVSDRVSIVFLEDDCEWLRIYRLCPVGELSSNALPRVRVQGTPVGQVVREGVARISDAGKDSIVALGHASRDHIWSTLSAPIRVGGKVIGALNAGSHRSGHCTGEMLHELEAIATQLGPLIFACEQSFASTQSLASTQTVVDLAPPPVEQLAVARGSGLVARSKSFTNILNAAHRAAQSDVDVLLTGETGVGKTALAQAIHSWGPRSAGPFVTVHIADLAPSIVESELFGHERGAFTGASVDRIGRFEAARGGTLFLDEIGETPLPIQAKLLRLIQERRFEKVGSNRTIAADVQIIAATSRDLRQLIASGAFREDLFYRLNVLPLHIPNLRTRRDDLEPLVAAILDRLSNAQGRRFRLAPATWQRVMDYAWPGNIRELECVLRRATILEDSDELTLADLHEDHASLDQEPGEQGWPTLAGHQRQYIAQVLEHCAGVIEGPQGAAKILGMRPSTLRSRMNKLGVSATPARHRQEG